MQAPFKAAFILTDMGFVCLTDSSQSKCSEQELIAIAKGKILVSPDTEPAAVEVGYWSTVLEYKCVWGESYIQPGAKIVKLMFFTEGVGYLEDDLEQILNLEVGQSVTLDCGDHSVERIA